MTVGIYQIRNILDGKVYVGQSQNIEQRWRLHRSVLTRAKHANKHLQCAWNKYGQSSFVFEILEICLIENLTTQEQFWLDTKYAYRRNSGYNLGLCADSPTRGRSPSVETRAKISLAGKGKAHTVEVRTKMSTAHRGVPLSPEHCAHITAGQKGRIVTVETRAKMSIARKNRVITAETRAKIGISNTRRKHSVSTQEKMSKARKQWWQKRKAQSNDKAQVNDL
jgi:group I intron endonuclease